MLEPKHDFVIVKLREEETTPSGIVMQQPKDESTLKADVVSVGPGKLENGVRQVPDVYEGDVVVVPNYAGQVIRDGNEKYVAVQYAHIIATVKDDA